LSDADRRWYKEKISWYQQLRSRATLSDSFFPLGNWQQPESSAWDGFARLSHESDGIVVLFKNKSDAKDGSIQIQAPPDASYEVRSVITGSSLGKVSSGDLAKGWQISFPTDHAVEILELRRIGR
jgi:alpha-galactosidase